jgi:hypothetical protein
MLTCRFEPIGFARPETYYKCTNMLHNCEKTITDPSGICRRQRAPAHRRPPGSRNRIDTIQPR